MSREGWIELAWTEAKRLKPGSVVKVQSGDAEINGRFKVVKVDHDLTVRGASLTLRVWVVEWPAWYVRAWHWMKAKAKELTA